MTLDGISIEAWKFGREIEWVWLNKILKTKTTLDEQRSVIVPIYKNEGYIQSCTYYRGIKLMSHSIKLQESNGAKTQTRGLDC